MGAAPKGGPGGKGQGLKKNGASAKDVKKEGCC